MENKQLTFTDSLDNKQIKIDFDKLCLMDMRAEKTLCPND